ncbi:unnamed protein product, partial [Porites lobata]
EIPVERAVNVISSVANGITPEDCLEGINLQLGDWHAAVKVLSILQWQVRFRSLHPFLRPHTY